CARKEDDLDVW
nr:immunoglobulin heavy chain junction region [Macaca mulatta]